MKKIKRATQMTDIDPREQLLFEQRLAKIERAIRIKYLTVEFNDSFNIRFGIELLAETDLTEITSAEFSKFIDSITTYLLESNLSDEITITNHYFNMISQHFSDRDITIECIDKLNQPLLTTYFFNNLPL